MGETVSSIPPGGYKKLVGADWKKGVGYILFGSISGIILFALSQDHFPTWPELRPFVITAATTLFGYIGKNYFTNNEGKMFKEDAETLTVGAKELDKVIDIAQEKTK